MSNPPSQKVALVTGSAIRIGKALIEALHAHQYRVIIHYHHSKKEAESLLQQCLQRRPNSAIASAANLDSPENCANLIKTAFEKWHRLDLLVNNASRYFPNVVGNTSETQWNELMNANLASPYFLSQAAFPHLKTTKGSIINMSDSAIAEGVPKRGYSAYNASKAGLNGLTRSLALEFAPDVRVNAIAPGSTLPPKEKSPEAIEKTSQEIPLKKYGNLDDIVRTLFFLIENTHITGQIISIDGGESLQSIASLR